MNIKGITGPNCEIKGCELAATFHGFNHDFCWQHYSNWMVRFRLTEIPQNDTMCAQKLGLDDSTQICLDLKGGS